AVNGSPPSIPDARDVAIVDHSPSAALENQVRTGLTAGGNRIRTIGPPWTHRSLQLSLDCVRAAARPTHRACDLDRRVRSLRLHDFLEVLHEADCILDWHQGALVHFRSWPAASTTGAR